MKGSNLPTTTLYLHSSREHFLLIVCITGWDYFCIYLFVCLECMLQRSRDGIFLSPAFSAMQGRHIEDPYNSWMEEWNKLTFAQSLYSTVLMHCSLPLPSFKTLFKPRSHDSFSKVFSRSTREQRALSLSSLHFPSHQVRFKPTWWWPASSPSRARLALYRCPAETACVERGNGLSQPGLWSSSARY